MTAWVVTRPFADSVKLSSFIESIGGKAFIEPLTTIRSIKACIDWHPVTHVIITSKHALPFWVSRPSYAKEVVLYRLGMHGNTVDDIVKKVKAEVCPRASHFLYMRGCHTTMDVVSCLHSLGYSAMEQVVYEAVAAQSLSSTLCTAVSQGRIRGICFFSSRSAQIFMDLWGKAALHSYEMGLTALTISSKVASLLRGMSWRRICIAETPSLAAMQRLLREIG